MPRSLLTLSRTKQVVIALILGLIFIAPVSAQDATPAPYTPGTDLAALSGNIISDGSSTVGPITEAVAEEFQAIASDVVVQVDISGTGGGFTRFCAGETDFQNASRPISEEEIPLCAEAGVDYYEFEVAYDGLSVVVNPDNDWVSCLTVDQLSQIWTADSAITNWSDLDTSWPEEEIQLFGAGPDSGTFDYFTGQINGEEGVINHNYSPSEDDNATVQGVAGDTNAMGFFGLAYYEQNADILRLVEVDGGNGCVAPSPETVLDGSYFPLSRPLYVYVKAESLTRPEVQEFTRFYISNAAVLAPDVGFVASPPDRYAADQAKLEAAIAGTAEPDSSATPAA